MADDGSAPPLHLLQRSERQTKMAAHPGGALHATEHLGPGSAFRQMKARTEMDLLCSHLHSGQRPSSYCHFCAYMLIWTIASDKYALKVCMEGKER